MKFGEDNRVIDKVIIVTSDGVRELNDVQSIEQKDDFFVIYHQTIQFYGVTKRAKDNLSYYHNSMIKELQIVFK